MFAVKAVKQRVACPNELLPVLNVFRDMVNYCIRVGLEKNISSRFKLSNAVYSDLHNHLHTWYILSAVEKATAILKNHKKEKRKNPNVKKPFVVRSFLAIGNQAYQIRDSFLRLPIQPKQFAYVPLNSHTLRVLSEPGLKLGSVMLTANTVSISFSKETAEIEPSGLIGIDRNLDNVTIANTEGNPAWRFDLSEATSIKSAYRTVKSHFKRDDVRVRIRIFRKYGLKQQNKVKQILHRVSKAIIIMAKKANHGIVMEKLTGIRRLYRKGNWQSHSYRAKMNSWSYYELQRQIEYKANWEGLPVIYVNAWGTSSRCSICGCATAQYPNGHRILQCANGHVLDRDVNAARNIAARGLRFRPVGLSEEAVRGNAVTMLIPVADESQPNTH